MCRIHRLGQKSECFVYRFVSADTVEEVMYKREVTKETNAKRVIDNEDIDNQVNNHETLFGSAAGSKNEENDSDKDNDESGCITIQHVDLLGRLTDKFGHLMTKVHPHDELLLSHGINERVAMPGSGPISQIKPKKRRMVNNAGSSSRFEVCRSSAKILRLTNSSINDHLSPIALNKK